MNGHPRPRRRTAGPDLPPSWQRRPSSLILVSLLALVLLLAASALVAGCGSETTTTTAASLETTTAPTSPSDTSTTAPSEETTASTAGEAMGGTFPVTVTDDNGNTVTIDSEPMRIVSTAPANTWTLFALGLGDRVVGTTSLPGEPPEAADIAKVGDYSANTEAIIALNPDLVIGYSGNEEALAPIQEVTPVIILNPQSLEQIYADITTVGAATGATDTAAEVVASIQAQIKAVTDVTSKIEFSPKVFYALDNTLWTAGPGSFVDELLKLVGATNIGSMGQSAATAQPYFQLTPEQLVASDPDVILLPMSTYQSVDEFTSDPRFTSLTAVQNGAVHLIDDVVITQPGPRIGEGIEALAKAIHPEAF
jgi:iron complex transport system substrate-binding protein